MLNILKNEAVSSQSWEYIISSLLHSKEAEEIVEYQIGDLKKRVQGAEHPETEGVTTVSPLLFNQHPQWGCWLNWVIQTSAENWKYSFSMPEANNVCQLRIQLPCLEYGEIIDGEALFLDRYLKELANNNPIYLGKKKHPLTKEGVIEAALTLLTENFTSRAIWGKQASSNAKLNDSRGLYKISHGQFDRSIELSALQGKTFLFLHSQGTDRSLVREWSQVNFRRLQEFVDSFPSLMFAGQVVVLGRTLYDGELPSEVMAILVGVLLNKGALYVIGEWKGKGLPFFPKQGVVLASQNGEDIGKFVTLSQQRAALQ